MAAYTMSATENSVHATASGTTHDTIAVTGRANGVTDRLEILNRDAAQTLWVRWDGTTAVAAAKGTIAILPLQSIITEPTAGVPVISVVGSSNAWSVHRLIYGTI